MKGKLARRSKQATSLSIAANHPYRHQKPSTSRTILKQTRHLWAWVLLITIVIEATILIAYILATGNSSLQGLVITFAGTVVTVIVAAIVTIVTIEQKSPPTSN